MKIEERFCAACGQRLPKQQAAAEPEPTPDIPAATVSWDRPVGGWDIDAISRWMQRRRAGQDGGGRRRLLW
jgi:hypothetical protein